LPETFSEFEQLHENILFSKEEPYISLKQNYEFGLVLKKLNSFKMKNSS